MQNLQLNNFVLQKLGEDLICMAIICALPENYANFTSSILLTWDPEQDHSPRYTKETNPQHHAVPTTSNKSDSMLFVAPGKS